MILDASAGQFPVADGGWHRLLPWRKGVEAAVAFTAHAVMCVDDDVESALLDKLGVDGLGGAHAPRVLTALAGPGGWTSSLDLIMVHRGHGDGGGGGGPGDPRCALVQRPELAGESRVGYAARLRDDLCVYGFPDPRRSAVAIVGRGIGGLRELSYELEPDRRGRGEGAVLVGAALRAIGAREPVVACVAPGNVASLRVLSGCGFVPVGSVQLFRRGPGYVPSLSG